MSRSNNVLMGAEEVLPPDHVKWTAHKKDQQAPAAASVDLLSALGKFTFYTFLLKTRSMI